MSTTTMMCYKTRSTPVDAKKIYRIAPTLTVLLNKKHAAKNRQEELRILHKLFIVLNANRQFVMDEGRLSQAVYHCASKMRVMVVAKSTNDKELKIAKHGRKQMDAFCEYYEALCLGSQSRITVDMFRLINTYLWFKK